MIRGRKAVFYCLDLIAASTPALLLISAITYTAWCAWWIR